MQTLKSSPRVRALAFIVLLALVACQANQTGVSPDGYPIFDTNDSTKVCEGHPGMIAVLQNGTKVTCPGTATTTDETATETPKTDTPNDDEPVLTGKFLRYDNGTSDCSSKKHTPEHPLVAGQEHFIAFYLCQAIDAGTEQAMMDAVAKIQKMAETVGAETWEDTSVTIPVGMAAVIWCSNTTGLVAPNDTAFPLGQEKTTTLEYDSPNGLGTVIVMPEIGGGVEGRTFSNCDNGNQEIWAVAVH